MTQLATPHTTPHASRRWTAQNGVVPASCRHNGSVQAEVYPLAQATLGAAAQDQVGRRHADADKQPIVQTDKPDGSLGLAAVLGPDFRS